MSNENIEEIIDYFKTSNFIFQDKINYIKSFISRYSSEEKIKTFIETIEDDSIYSYMLSKIWHNSFIIESFPLTFLSSSYEKLTCGNNTRTKLEFIPPEKVVCKKELPLNISDKTFKETVTEFYTEIAKKLPINLKELLCQAPNSNESYNWFLYCLHLIQKHILEYDKRSGMIKNTGKDLEEI